jgi:hypothetical protein
MPLPMTTVTVYEVDSDDLEFFITEQYPNARKFFFGEDGGCGNTPPSRYVVKKEELALFDRAKVDRFASGEYEFDITRLLLNDLCNRDLIPEGTYIIKVIW